mmetsp:Transcript_20204/g.36115  ORF Transcript_20204/g.36115 Transcript_20204/m.36115 type:complete len:144 (+) Transcript_20204:88-519(+)
MVTTAANPRRQGQTSQEMHPHPAGHHAGAPHTVRRTATRLKRRMLAHTAHVDCWRPPTPETIGGKVTPDPALVILECSISSYCWQAFSTSSQITVSKTVCFQLTCIDVCDVFWKCLQVYVQCGTGDPSVTFCRVCRRAEYACR